MKREPGRRSLRRPLVFLLTATAAWSGLVVIPCIPAILLVGSGWDVGPGRLTEIYITTVAHLILGAAAGMAAVELRRRPALGARPARCMLLACTLGAVLSADRIAGVFVPPRTENSSIYELHSRRGWRHRPFAQGTVDAPDASINSLGLRGPELSMRKPDGAVRILLLGDSITFGFRTAYPQTLGPQLQDALHARNVGRVECINSGVSGYATWQELDYLEHEGIRLDPDLVVVGFCYNDVTDMIGVAPGDVSGILPAFSESDSWLYASGLMRAGRAACNAWLSRHSAWIGRTRITRSNPADLCKDRDDPVVRAAWQRALHDLDSLNDYCKTRHQPWVLCIYPLREQFDPGGDSINNDQLLVEWAARRDVPALNLRPAFKKYLKASAYPTERLFLQDDPLHITAEGYRLAATELADYLCNEHLVTATQPSTQGSRADR